MELNEKERSALLLVLEHIDLSEVASHDDQVAEAVATLEAGLYPTRVVASADAPRAGEKSVFAYFAETLDIDPNDESLAQLGVATNCGCDCVRAIDAASQLLQHVENAGCEGRDGIILAANAIVETYWRG